MSNQLKRGNQALISLRGLYQFTECIKGRWGGEL